MLLLYWGLQLILQKAIFNSYWLLSRTSKPGIRDNDTCWNCREAGEKAIGLPWFCKSILEETYIQQNMILDDDTPEHLDVSLFFLLWDLNLKLNAMLKYSRVRNLVGNLFHFSASFLYHCLHSIEILVIMVNISANIPFPMWLSHPKCLSKLVQNNYRSHQLLLYCYPEQPVTFNKNKFIIKIPLVPFWRY